MTRSAQVRGFLQAALNGDRLHPATPRTPDEIAEQARSAVGAGAHSVHVHVFDDEGRQTLAEAPTTRTLRAIRRIFPDLPISLKVAPLMSGCVNTSRHG